MEGLTAVPSRRVQSMTKQWSLVISVQLIALLQEPSRMVGFISSWDRVLAPLIKSSHDHI